MNYDGLAPDQMEKAKTRKTVDELAELAKSEGIELSDAKCSPAEMCDGWSRLGVESTATVVQEQSERTPHELRRPEGPQVPGETEGC